jgi:ParB family chromosome partitioning protein
LLRLNDSAQQLASAQQIVDRSLTVAQTEAMVDALLAAQPTKSRKRPTFIVKDVRLFLNTITHSLDLMRTAGVDAQCQRQDTDEEILLTIHIPRKATP